MPELIHGPVPNWVPTEEFKTKIETMLESDDDLVRAYGEVYQAGCFVTEFGGSDETRGIAAVGEMTAVEVAEFRLGQEIDPSKLSMADCMELRAYPGTGSTRTERVQDGLRQALEERDKERDPDTLDLFGSFTENGYRVDALMPRNSQQPRQWTVRVYVEGQEDVFREETIAMLHEPIFGVDEDDKAALEARVDLLMKELSQ